jgi:dephospho-CoA kinase
MPARPLHVRDADRTGFDLVPAAAKACLIGIGGQIGCGKTTTARMVAELGDGTVLAVSDAVKKQAESLGLEKNRESLQDLAWKTVNSDLEAFARQILGCAMSGLVVVEGIRLLTIWNSLLDVGQPAATRLVSISVPWEERARRVHVRDGLSEAELKLVDAHPIERGWRDLRSHADLMLDGQLDPAELAERILEGLPLD